MKEGQSIRLRPLIAACMQSQAALQVELSSQTVQIRNVETSDLSGALHITGYPSIPDLDLGTMNRVSAKLVLPLLFDISTLCLPHRNIVYLGREFRSLADFFARNLFHAAVRNTIFEIQLESPRKLTENSKNFKNEYFYILKHALFEECLKTRNAKESIDIIALNACLDAQYFNHAILNRPLGSGRLGSQNDRYMSNLADLKMRLLNTRSALLAQD